MIGKYKVQVIAILVGCILIAAIALTSVKDGALDDSIVKLVKAIAVLFSAIMYGVLSNESGGGNNE